jgi:hypothetical protein
MHVSLGKELTVQSREVLMGVVEDKDEMSE